MVHALHHDRVPQPHAFARFGAGPADFGALAAEVRRVRRLTVHEVVGQAADSGAIGEQGLMFSRGVLAAPIETMDRRSQAGILALMAGAGAVLQGFGVKHGDLQSSRAFTTIGARRCLCDEATVKPQ